MVPKGLSCGTAPAVDRGLARLPVGLGWRIVRERSQMTGKRLPDAGDDGAGRRSSNSVVTMAEVAERAGGSTATVSRVLCGRSSVAPEYRVKVNAAVDELSYRCLLY